MNEETNMYWLPHYIINKEKVLFLNKYDMGIQVAPKLSLYIKDGIFTKDLQEILEEDIVRQLLLSGIVIPWNDNRNIKWENKCHRPRCLVIQPHSDDAAFSCSGFIQSHITKENAEVDLVTIFTRYKYGDSPWSKYFELDDLCYEKIRKSEDELFSSYTGCNLISLDYKDARFRSKLSVISKSGLLRNDMGIKDMLKCDLLGLLDKLHPELILLPLGIGNHRDHLIVYSACLELLKEISYSGEIRLYEDYPYCNMDRFTYFSRLHEVNMEQRIQPVFADIKEKLISKAVSFNIYRSQFVEFTFKQIQEEVSNVALSITYERRLYNEITDDGLKYAERFWRVRK